MPSRPTVSLTVTQTKDLIVFVLRWAKDCGICQASTSHMSPYAWTILCNNFCQVDLSN